MNLPLQIFQAMKLFYKSSPPSCPSSLLHLLPSCSPSTSCPLFSLLALLLLPLLLLLSLLPLLPLLLLLPSRLPPALSFKLYSLAGDQSTDFGRKINDFISEMRGQSTEPHQKMLSEVGVSNA